ncbi:NAD(P)-dependent oxidoreductase [Pseudomonas sp. ICMP22404]|nr:NAD(P)-dependent oxidoreductase [Pseudomonas sp. ICMP22404]
MRVSLESSVVAADIQRVARYLEPRELLVGQRILLTGCTGFFGKWLLATLAHLNQGGASIEVTAVSRSPQAFLSEYPEYVGSGWIKWLQHDVQAPLDIAPGARFDLVIHAATDTLAGAHADLLRIYDTILGGARHILDLAVRTGTRRILFTGTGAQYGPLEFGHPVTESSPSSCPSHLAGSAYAEAKRAQETLAAIYAQKHGLEIVLARCFAFSGPGIALDAHFAIGNFVRDALWKDELLLHSSGRAVRSYLHGADLAVWLLTLLVRGAASNAYNVGSDKGLTIAELACKVVDRISPGKQVKVLGVDEATQARSYYVPDIEKARGLGLDDWTSLDQSIDSTARWIRENH